MRGPAKAAATAATAALLLAGCSGGSPGHPASGSGTRDGGGTKSAAAGGPPGVVTPVLARQVFSLYTASVNQANKARSVRRLATIESAASYRIDAGAYRWTKVTDPKNRQYATQTFTSPVYYIPRQASYPAWFVVHATQHNAPVSMKAKPSSYGVYMIFRRATASASWKQVMEPQANHLPGTVPAVATDGQGYATALPASTAGALAVAPDALPAKHVAYLDYRNKLAAAKAPPPRPGLPKPKRPPKPLAFAHGQANLGDFSDTRFWDKHMPKGSTVRDTHATTAAPVYALRTTGGGALVFYDLTASLFLGTPNAIPFSITVPGIFNGKVHRAAFTVNYSEQFAVSLASGAGAKPQVVADDSGPVGGTCDGGHCQ